jgi:putative membrane protein insertion efficiency factor
VAPPHTKRQTAIRGGAADGRHVDACWCAGCLASHLYLKATNGREEEGKDWGLGNQTMQGGAETGMDGIVGESGGSSEEDRLADAMISALKGYKAFISPLLPPSCRFLPTCSIYSMQAIREFGPSKGAVLTAWRLIRCNPLHWAKGGRGYDPPAWPPVSYNYASDPAALKEELAAFLEKNGDSPSFGPKTDSAQQTKE